MALYGSSVANLSPILFRGNLFSEGVNLVFYTDISYSMNFDPNGNVNYDSDRPNLGNIGAGSTTSMFYDGIFGAKLQTELLNSNVGNSSPNLYTYFDQTLRVKTGTQDVVLDTEVYRYSPSVIIADSNYSTSSKLKDLWVTDYIDRDQGLLTPGTTNFNIASKISGSTANRFSGFDLANNPGQFSEDVHGNLWSLYYCGSTGANRITDGLVNDSSSFIGRYLNSLPRKDLTTFVIAASNEQENTASNLAGIGITTKNNVGYTTSKYNFGQPGFYARRYDHYYLDDEFNGGVSVQTTGGGSYGTLNFENWFTGVAEGGLPPAQPLPFGLIDPSLWTGVDLFGNVTAPTIVDGQPVFITGGTNEDAPGLNWYVDGNGEEGPGDVNLEGTQIVDWENTNITATNSGYADIAIPNHPYAGNSARYGPTKRAFWGPINYIDRLRSDIADYSLMIIGYFSPQFSSGETGTVKFKLQSNGVSCLWIGSDSLGNSTNDAILSSSIDDDGFGEQSKVYNGWTIDNATIACPSNAADQYDILSRVQSRNDVFEEESVDLQMTAGRYYPFRLIVGNPNVASNTFSQGGVNQPNLQLSDSNPSFLRLLFDVGDGYRVDGNGFFFGGTEVWEEGSPFFPPNVEIVERTIEEELKYRNTRVISLASYDSTDGYDAVFVKDVDAVPPKYMYVNLDEFDFTFIESNNSPLSGGWGVGRYFDPIEFRIEDDDSNFSRQANTITGVIPVGTGASFTINKFNDRYITDVSVGGTGYTIGDRFTINFSALGETNVDNNLVLDVTEVEALSYNIITTSADNFVERSITNATFNVQKNLNSNNTYTVDLVDSGSEYQIDDKLLISGLDLDGGSANDLIITVNSILGSGEVDTFTVSGTPSQLINYNVNLNSYKPLPANFTYEPTDIDTIEYRTSFNSGIAYTTAAITGIAYSTLTGTGIGHSTFDIIGIAYTQIDNEETTKIGIAYSTANITGISYTTSTVTGLAYTFANVTGVAYSGEQITGVGYTSLQVVSIGYTSPNLTSIGYTAFQISSIDYDGKIGISSIELFEDGSPPTNPDNAEIYVELTGNTTLFSGIQEILIDGTGQPALDSSLGAGIHTTTLIASEDGSGQQWRFQISQINDSLISEDSGTIFTPGAFLIALNDPQTAAAGFGSTATVTTTQEHTFVDGDIINIVGVTGDTGNDTEFNDVFTIEQVLSTTSFTLQNSGTVGLFTGTAIGAGGTVGYDQAELELEIPFSIETESVGITSIYYEELYKQYSAATSRPRFFLNADPYNAGTLVEFDLEGDPGVQWNGQTASDITNFGEYVGIGSVVYLFFDDGNGDISSDATPRPLDYRQLGYGHTVVEFRGANNRRFGVETPNGYAGNTQNIPQGGYWIVGGDTPIVTTDSSLPESFVDGKVVTISGNNNADYNNEWQILNATTDSFELADRSTGIASTATDLLTPSSTFDAPGAANAGTASSEFTDVAYRFDVGLGITVFGVTGESAIYNDGYTIIGIKSSTPSIDNTPYAFILKENQTPTELALQGTSGKIGIHTISGIATVTSTANFGSPGDVVQLKIQDAPATFFNQTYASARILDATRFLLGTESERDLNTPNPEEYSSSSNTDGSTIGGLVGSNLVITHSSLTGSYVLTDTDSVDVFGTTNWNDTEYSVISTKVVGPNIITEVNRVSTAATDFTLTETTGEFGVRDLNPIVDFSNSNTILFRNPLFGSAGTIVNLRVQNTLKDNVDGVYVAKLLTDTSALLEGSAATNPIDAGSNYSTVGAGGTVGLIGSRLAIQLADPIVYNVGDRLGIQNVPNQFGETFILNDLTIITEIINNTNPYVLTGNDVSNSGTDFGIVGSNLPTAGGTILVEDAIVTAPGHPFVTGDEIKIQDVVGNGGLFDYNTVPSAQPYQVTVIDSNTFSLDGTTGVEYYNDFRDANGGAGTAGLLNYPATVTSINHPFVSGQTVKIENNPLFNGSYIINVLDADRFRLNVNAGLDTDFTSPLNAGDDVYIALRNEGVTVSYSKQNVEYGGASITSPINIGDQVRLQGTDNADGVYNVTWSKQTSPYEFGIEPTEPAVFDGFDQDTTAGTAGLSDSRLRVRANSHNLTNGQNITIQNSSPTDFDGNYTVEVLNANFIELTNSTQSTSGTDYTQTSTSGVLGYPGYPATAELSVTSLPIGIENGVQLRIVGDNQPFAPSGSTIQNVNIEVYRNDGTNPVLLGLTNVTSSTELYNVTYDNAGLGYTGGLRNVEPIITFTPSEAIKLGLTNPSFQVGNNVPLDIINTTDFASGFYNSILLPGTSPYALQLIGAQNPSNNIFDVKDTFFNVGLANSDRIISSPSHGFTSVDISQNAAIFINTDDPSNQVVFGGDYYISEIIDSDTFAVRNYPSNNSTALPAGSDDDYTVNDTDGYYVGFGTGVRLNCNNNFFNNRHALDVGETLTISGTTNYNGSYTVVERISDTDVRLNGPYPSPVNDIDGFDDYTQTENGTFVPTPGTPRICPITIRREEDRYRIPAGGIGDLGFFGSNYKVDEQYVISGADLNGDAVNNRLLILISSVLSGGGVNAITLRTAGTVGNTPDPDLDYNPTTFALSQAFGDGVNATFNITRKGEYDSLLGVTTYSEVTVNNAGQFYQVNESLLIQGSELGGISPDNDLIITIENVGGNGEIVGTGFTFVGVSSDGSPLKTVGITTLYTQPNDSSITVSKPIGLEETWRRDGSLNFTEPPAGQGELKQTHDMITLAKANKGGVIKSSRVFEYGDIAKQAEIFEIFAYGYRGIDANTNTSGESNIIYDTNGNSGIATISLDSDDNNDDQMMQGIRPGDTVYILSRLEPAVQNNSNRFPDETIIRETFTDYTVVGYGFTVIGIYSNPDAGESNFNEPAGRDRNFNSVIRSFGQTFYNGPITGEGATAQGPLGSGYQNPDDGLYYSFAFGTGFDQLVIQTANKNATLNDNISDDISFIIVRGEEPILVRTNGIHPFVPGERIYIENTKLFDRNTLISPNVNPGLAGTSFIMSPTNTDVGDKGVTTFNALNDRAIVQGTTTEFSAGEGYRTFQIQDDSGNPITMNSISPTGETYFELFMKNCSGMRLGEGFMNVFDGGNLDQSWEDAASSDPPDWSRLNYPVVYGTRGVNGENPDPGGNSDRVATRFILAQGGLAYTLVPGGAPRVDNRIGLAKALAKFISDNVKGETA